MYQRDMLASENNWKKKGNLKYIILVSNLLHHMPYLKSQANYSYIYTENKKYFYLFDWWQKEHIK